MGCQFFSDFLWGPKFFGWYFAKFSFSIAKCCTGINSKNVVLMRKKAAKPRVGFLPIVQTSYFVSLTAVFWRHLFWRVNQMEVKVKACFPSTVKQGARTEAGDSLWQQNCGLWELGAEDYYSLLYLRNHVDHVDVDAIIVLLVQGEYFKYYYFLSPFHC